MANIMIILQGGAVVQNAIMVVNFQVRCCHLAITSGLCSHKSKNFVCDPR